VTASRRRADEERRLEELEASFNASDDFKAVPPSQYYDLLTNGHVTKLSQLINLMARLKLW